MLDKWIKPVVMFVVVSLMVLGAFDLQESRFGWYSIEWILAFMILLALIVYINQKRMEFIQAQINIKEVKQKHGNDI